MSLAFKRSSVISDIINNRGIITHFQPIVSIKKKSVIGLEALSRGVCPDSGSILPPDMLISQAEEKKLTLDLDRLCRQKALENFARMDCGDRDVVLFMNFDASIIDLGIVGSGHLIKQVRQLNLNPNNVAIEIIESRVNDTGALNEFISRHREYGFLFALDDIGSGYSNLDRITITEPDMLKIDHSLISEIDINFRKQEVLKSLVNLAKRIGALVVAEGVEREEEAVKSLELGVDMLQGFYFLKPAVMAGSDWHVLHKRVNSVSNKFKNYMVKKINAAKHRHTRYQNIVNQIIDSLATVTPEAYNDLLKDLINRHPNLECIYLLDEQGIQISDTFCNYRNVLSHRGSLYKPAPRGADHSLKDYYYLLTNTGTQRFNTDPYISLASGNLCITISALFKARKNDHHYILCIDINQDL